MKNDIVQFIEKHKWCGCLGIITEVKIIHEGIRYMIGVPIPQQGTAFIYATDDEVEIVGRAVMVLKDSDKE